MRLIILSFMAFVASAIERPATAGEWYDAMGLVAMDPYVSVSGTLNDWGSQSNDDELETGSERRPGGALEGGIYLTDNFSVGVELACRNHLLHGLNDRDRGIKRTLDGNDLTVCTAMLGVGAEHDLGFVGLEFIRPYVRGYTGAAHMWTSGPDLDRSETTPAFNGRAGLLINLPLDGLSLDVGAGYLHTLPFSQDGFEVEYGAFYGQVGLQYKF